MNEDGAVTDIPEFDFRQLLQALNSKQIKTIAKKQERIRADLKLIGEISSKQEEKEKLLNVAENLISKLEELINLSKESVELQERNLTVAEEVEKLDEEFTKLMSCLK